MIFASVTESGRRGARVEAMTTTSCVGIAPLNVSGRNGAPAAKGGKK